MLLAASVESSAGQQASYILRQPLPADVTRLAVIEQQCGEFSACWSAEDIQVR
jgi:hypothetical protein